jgi:DNA-binding MarR family transcriptional regulator
MSELAHFFSVTPSAATLLVEGLVKDKLLTRIADKHDRRGVRLALTAKGNRAMEGAVEAKMKKLEDIFSVLSQKEQDTLAAILEKVVAEKQKRNN